MIISVIQDEAEFLLHVMNLAVFTLFLCSALKLSLMRVLLFLPLIARVLCLPVVQLLVYFIWKYIVLKNHFL